MDRPFLQSTVDELEMLLRAHTTDRFTLARLREELLFRSTDRAHQLLREVEGLLSGVVPTKREARPAQPEDQVSLLPDDDLA
jgi:hypothetical protein